MVVKSQKEGMWCEYTWIQVCSCSVTPWWSLHISRSLWHSCHYHHWFARSGDMTPTLWRCCYMAEYCHIQWFHPHCWCWRARGRLTLVSVSWCCWLQIVEIRCRFWLILNCCCCCCCLCFCQKRKGKNESDHELKQRHREEYRPRATGTHERWQQPPFGNVVEL